MIKHKFINNNAFFIVFLLFVGCISIWIYPQLNDNIITSDGYWYYDYLKTLFIDKNLSINKYPIGTAILETPFFMIAHVLSHILTPDKCDGYSHYYQLLIYISGYFYYCIGITALYSSVKCFYGVTASLLTCIALTFGTPVIYCTKSLARQLAQDTFFLLFLKK